MSESIIKSIKGRSNVILAGDTNARPANRAMRSIEKYLKSVFGDELTTSFNMRRKNDPGYAASVVDMFFVSPNIKVLKHYCPDVDISDHLPLVMTIELPRK